MWPTAPAFDLKELQPVIDAFPRLIERLEGEAQSVGRRLGPSFLHWLTALFRRDIYSQWCDARDRVAFVRAIRNALIDLKALTGTFDVALWDGQPLDSDGNQRRAFWQGQGLNVLRSDLFAAAMALHEAFFLEAASNDVVIALSSMLSSPPLPSARTALWQWFFMLTPVVSSTFASVRRQFAGIGVEGLGWLVIDEAGQAVPQAAVGAMMRARRVVVVGDPLQIPPVVTQSTRLLARLGQHWLKDSRARYAVDSHSVQTLADRIYPMGVRHPVDDSRFIGIPLVMHRRCDNPMFDIANAIAYGGRMKHAKDGSAAAHPVFRKSSWWNVCGETEGDTKYVSAQGEHLLQALFALYRHDIATRGPTMPRVFVITPFRQVKSGLLALLGDHDVWQQGLAGWDVPVPTDLQDWARISIGTVHTFQGKENDVVFFVLGCDQARGGAVDWACAEPNLLNVALTRAKSHVYVIGDRDVWAHKRYFSVAAGMLDTDTWTPALRDELMVEVP
ncbi:AAA domain-containing protein [Luteibacter rhizovicinus]|uniref:AAA domain-containing protein n=1 Tax=Luteibacter rhizovicinus TaxID=242606 RepID=A0A4R3YHF1_9GAMM|nr:AAA domain-containing protein [Luteibacter rhizovicinus]